MAPIPIETPQDPDPALGYTERLAAGDQAGFDGGPTMTLRIPLAVVSMIAMLASNTIDVRACGDKFLRLGRSMRQRAYASVHPTAILVFVPAKAKASDLKDFESTLKRAGHRPTLVGDLDTFSAAVATGRFEIVISALADAPRLKAHVASAPSPPQFLPIVPKAPRDIREQVDREYPFSLKEYAPRQNALAVIDDAIDARLARVRAHDAPAAPSTPTERPSK